MKKLSLFLLFIFLVPNLVYAEECEVKKNYRIAFATNDSETISKISVTDDIILPILNNDDSNFIGWYYDEELTIQADINKSSDIDYSYYKKISTTECEEYYELKLYAKWENICDNDIVTHHIIYVTNTNEKINKISVPKDENELVTLKNPTRDGYKFIGWYYDSKFKEKVNITTYADINKDYYIKVSSNECNDFYELKIYAKWEKINISNSNSNKTIEKSNNEEDNNIQYTDDDTSYDRYVKYNDNKVVIYIVSGLLTILLIVVCVIIYKKRKK